MTRKYLELFIDDDDDDHDHDHDHDDDDDHLLLVRNCCHAALGARPNILGKMSQEKVLRMNMQFLTAPQALGIPVTFVRTLLEPLAWIK